MGKTLRNIGQGQHRKPRGAKAAKIAGARSVPPDAWDDASFGAYGEACRPVFRYLETRVGKSWNKTQAHIAEKYGDAILRHVQRCVTQGPVIHPYKGKLYLDGGLLKRWR